MLKPMRYGSEQSDFRSNAGLAQDHFGGSNPAVMHKRTIGPGYRPPKSGSTRYISHDSGADHASVRRATSHSRFATQAATRRARFSPFPMPVE